MWNRVLFGYDSYYIILWFLIYSVLGWVVESIYMSICNKKWTNRGFAKGPICPIYGVGALTVFLVLKPYSDNLVVLFVSGAVLATLLEYLTARLMLRLFGEVWWDYNEKPFNYKGILCLESTLAWGLYTVILFVFLQNAVMRVGDVIPRVIGQKVGSAVLLIGTIDYITSLYQVKKDDMPERVEEMKEYIVEKLKR